MRQDLWNPRSTTFYLQAVAVVATIVALLYAASTSLMTMMGQHLVHADPLEHVDVMIVLAPALDRVIEAAELYRSGYAPMRALHDVPVKVIVRPSQLYGFRSDSWWRSRDTLTDGVYEWQKLVYYRLFELRD